MSDARGAFERIVRLEELPERGLLGAARSTGERVCLIRNGDEVYAVQDECTHQAFPLSAGTLTPGDGCRLECVWHGAQFEVTTGEAVKGPAEEPIVRYAVQVREGWVLVGPAL
jgi:3-phenylpropionate/trans-cinnamate dioxygenase ferredoxin subunit